LWNPESWSSESGIPRKECGIPLTIGIQNPSSTDKDWSPEPKTALDFLTWGDMEALLGKNSNKQNGLKTQQGFTPHFK